MRKVQKNNKEKHTFRKIMIFLLIVTIAGAALYYGCMVRNVNVIGSSHYTKEQIQDEVITGRLEKNAVLLYLKYKYLSQPEIPFIEKIDIELVNPVTVNINVYEKIVTGCVEHMGQLLYFDKDGMIVESSTRKIEYVPVLEGLKFDKLVLNEKLEIQNEKMFDTILSVTQLIKKYQLNIDKAIFLPNGELKLISGDIRIFLGKRDVYDAQIADLNNIFPMMENLSGELDLRNIKEGKNKFVFKQDD